MKQYIIILLSILSLATNAQTVDSIPNAWGKIDSKVAPWAQNISRPNKIDKGLQGRHISVWASHGRYYEHKKEKWIWQRPNLFATIEDIFTQTIVIPYLIPMLENAGAYVFTPRERDWQRRECIVDNDKSWPAGTITNDHATKLTYSSGFKLHTGVYTDGDNPFDAGSSLVMKVTKPNKATTLTYIPQIDEPGEYAVYVSYPFLEDAVDDVTYTVCHKGIRTKFSVNQQIGYGTWVYLGTFDFGLSNAEYQSANNCVIVSSASEHKGSVGTDAIRFGGGMGNIQRGGQTSGLPRCLEASRYYTQWAGVPDSVYNATGEESDYRDDIYARTYMTNWVGGGSVYMPTVDGLKVPIELALAVHSDAGYNEDGKSIHGSLAIATTNNNDGLLSSGVSRYTSLDFASRLLDNLDKDMKNSIGTWNKRHLLDRNYGETRVPEVPSAIIETLSHQSFPDMAVGNHPLGKFAIARSLYKSVLRYICDQHNKKSVVAPLAPADFRISIKEDNKIELQWTGVNDPFEPTAKPTSYNIYTAIDDNGFDNGQNIKSTVASMRLQPGVQYNFKITACNDGGESFPTETLSAWIAPNSAGTILVVNGFERLSAPHIINQDSIQGFDLSIDEGVQRGIYNGYCGNQTGFDMRNMGLGGEYGLGYSTNELEGVYIAGNEFNYVVDHTRAIASAKRYSVVSSSLSALNKNLVDLTPYRLVDLAFGLQKDDGQLGTHFKTFTPQLCNKLRDYAITGGAILTSGSFLGSDMQSIEEQTFMNEVLKLRFYPADTHHLQENITGLGMQYDIFRYLNDKHYAATHPEVLSPNDESFCAMQYSDGTSAAVAYRGKYSCFTMGFPFECIKEPTLKDKIMQGILAYLLN